MSKYTSMSAGEGRRFLSNIWNLFFKSLTDGNFFVEPWENYELRDCAEFRPVDREGQLDEILFFVVDEELARFLNETLGEIYLFGAYNQINVCQMRASGTVALAEGHPETEQIKKRLHDAIKSRVGASIHKLDEKEAKERYASLENGKLFRFLVSSYAYSMYERG